MERRARLRRGPSLPRCADPAIRARPRPPRSARARRGRCARELVLVAGSRLSKTEHGCRDRRHALRRVAPGGHAPSDRRGRRRRDQPPRLAARTAIRRARGCLPRTVPVCLPMRPPRSSPPASPRTASSRARRGPRHPAGMEARPSSPGATARAPSAISPSRASEPRWMQRRPGDGRRCTRGPQRRSWGWAALRWVQFTRWIIVFANW